MGNKLAYKAMAEQSVKTPAFWSPAAADQVKCGSFAGNYHAFTLRCTNLTPIQRVPVPAPNHTLYSYTETLNHPKKARTEHNERRRSTERVP